MIARRLMRPKTGTPNPREVELRCAEKKKGCFWPSQVQLSKEDAHLLQAGYKRGDQTAQKVASLIDALGMSWHPSTLPASHAGLVGQGAKPNGIRFDSYHSAAKRWCVVDGLDGYFGKSLSC